MYHEQNCSNAWTHRNRSYSVPPQLACLIHSIQAYQAVFIFKHQHRDLE